MGGQVASKIAFVIALIVLLAASSFPQDSISLLNASYEPTRELYRDFNGAFVKHWKQKTGKGVTIRQSYGASGHQSRAVKDGLIPADVVTLALAYDVDYIANAGLIDRGWRKRLPGGSWQPHVNLKSCRFLTQFIDAFYNVDGPTFTLMDQYRMISLYASRIAMAKVDDMIDIWRTLESLRVFCNECWQNRQAIEPS